MRLSNATLISTAINDAADILLDEVFAVLKDNNITLGLKLKREIMERVEKRLLATTTTEEN